MKYLFLVTLFFTSISITQTIAQNQQTSDNGEVSTIAAKKAAAEAGIIQKVSSNTGKVSYYRKNVCLKSGKVNLTEVQYCTKSGKFIHAAAASYEKTNCLRTRSDCSKGTAVNSVSSPRQTSECTPAQKAACSSAAAKTAMAKKAKA